MPIIIVSTKSDLINYNNNPSRRSCSMGLISDINMVKGKKWEEGTESYAS